MARSGLETRCFAIDSWQGDEQAEYYREAVYLNLSRYHDERYGGFSELLWSNFDDALPSESSIELLHIDGLDTYEAVENDFASWRPKLSERAVVLFHDTNVRERDFGVWRLWEQLRSQFPSFEFLHEHGLGVLAVGPATPSEVLELCSVRYPAKVQAIRQRFSLLGERWSFAAQAELLRKEVAAGKSRIASLEAETAQQISVQAQNRARAAQRAATARPELTTLLATGFTARSTAHQTDRARLKTQIAAPELFESQTMQSNGRIAVVLHLHYTDLWHEFEQAISSINEPFDLFVTMTTTDGALEDKIQDTFRQARILHFENKGRDILPFVALINSGILFSI